MAYPPTLPSLVDVTNETPQVDRHPGDHNLIAEALNVLPWGRVASTISTSTAGAISTDADVATVTFPAVAGRRYIVRASYNGMISAAGNAFGKITDGANTALQVQTMTFPASGYFTASLWVEIPPGAAGSRTYKLRASATGGTITLQGGTVQPHQILVEDVGV